jgi:branched-chain amino acid transport system ATP-binding protein
LTLLEVENLICRYGAIEAVRGISFSVNQGECLAVLGANGAGKTTTLAAITRLKQAAAGDIRFQGQPLASLNPAQIVRLGVTLVPEGRRVFPGLTVAENLEMGAFVEDSVEKSEQRFEQVYGLFPRLHERRSQKAGSLSGGEQQMLAIGRALMRGPRLLLLDEPSMGLAPVIIKDIFATLARLREQGLTMLIVEQNANLALRLADQAVVLRSGRIVLTGPADAIRGDALREAYIG